MSSSCFLLAVARFSGSSTWQVRIQFRGSYGSRASGFHAWSESRRTAASTNRIWRSVPTAFALLALIALFGPRSVWAQYDCDWGGTSFNPPAVDFDNDVQPIFDRSCVSCHQPGTAAFTHVGLDLRPGEAHRSLFNRISSQNPAWRMLTPFAPGVTAESARGSLLLSKVRCNEPGVGERMPPGGAGIPLVDQLILHSWELRGAPSGMDGSGAGRSIQYGMTGSWYDPSASGQGFFFEVIERNPRVLAASWSTFVDRVTSAADAANDLHPRPEQNLRWMIAIGAFVEGEDRVDLDVQQVRRGLFDEPTAPRDQVSTGSARLMFHSCTEATFRYTLDLGVDAGIVERSIALRRLVASPLCSEQE